MVATATAHNHTTGKEARRSTKSRQEMTVGTSGGRVLRQQSFEAGWMLHSIVAPAAVEAAVGETERVVKKEQAKGLAAVAVAAVVVAVVVAVVFERRGC